VISTGLIRNPHRSCRAQARQSYNTPRTILPFSCHGVETRQGAPGAAPLPPRSWAGTPPAAVIMPLLQQIRPLGAVPARDEAAGTLFASITGTSLSTRCICRMTPGWSVTAMKRANVKRPEVFDATQTRLRLLIAALQDNAPAEQDDDLESLDFTVSEPDTGEDTTEAQTTPEEVPTDQ
jgi:hypothetical protein